MSKKKEIKKTNVARLLDISKVNYELVEYVVDESDLGAEHIAEQLGENIKQVFKTIVMHGDTFLPTNLHWLRKKETDSPCLIFHVHPSVFTAHCYIAYTARCP